jgi:hypothetical protein
VGGWSLATWRPRVPAYLGCHDRNPDPAVGAALETARLFIEALNARDVETLRAAVTDDVLRGTAAFEVRHGRISAVEVLPAT